ncbi:hypothetical protein [Acidovorax sp. CF316]|uniref:hypothetical protein n=1 Tax=Acidovorax sp. CF316 TaxID=1144317 RepID=UPI0012F7E9FD|nr:hypothetical protein [Acidovorax sp. CF316]
MAKAYSLHNNITDTQLRPAGSHLLPLHDANHADCFIEYEAPVLRALEDMRG